jgi:uncharacterized repeat protein (TIGR04138 family)
MRDRRALRNILKRDSRYAAEAYIFVLEALHHTRGKIRAKGHVTGQQLLEGIKDLALSRYGAMAKIVFEHWGIKKTIDFGNIVLNMVNEKILSKTPEDKLEDFKDVYDFDEVFVKGYRPKLVIKKDKLRRNK